MMQLTTLGRESPASVSHDYEDNTWHDYAPMYPENLTVRCSKVLEDGVDESFQKLVDRGCS
jgi:hypothetical protein